MMQENSEWNKKLLKEMNLVHSRKQQVDTGGQRTSHFRFVLDFTDARE